MTPTIISSIAMPMYPPERDYVKSHGSSRLGIREKRRLPSVPGMTRTHTTVIVHFNRYSQQKWRRMYTIMGFVHQNLIIQFSTWYSANSTVWGDCIFPLSFLGVFWDIVCVATNWEIVTVPGFLHERAKGARACQIWLQTYCFPVRLRFIPRPEKMDTAPFHVLSLPQISSYLGRFSSRAKREGGWVFRFLCVLYHGEISVRLGWACERNFLYRRPLSWCKFKSIWRDFFPGK